MHPDPDPDPDPHPGPSILATAFFYIIIIIWVGFCASTIYISWPVLSTCLWGCLLIAVLVIGGATTPFAAVHVVWTLARLVQRRAVHPKMAFDLVNLLAAVAGAIVFKRRDDSSCRLGIDIQRASRFPADHVDRRVRLRVRHLGTHPHHRHRHEYSRNHRECDTSDLSDASKDRLLLDI